MREETILLTSLYTSKLSDLLPCYPKQILLCIFLIKCKIVVTTSLHVTPFTLHRYCDLEKILIAFFWMVGPSREKYIGKRRLLKRIFHSKCYGLNRVPQKFIRRSHNPEIVTLFGKRVFADAIS